MDDYPERGKALRLFRLEGPSVRLPIGPWVLVAILTLLALLVAFATESNSLQSNLLPALVLVLLAGATRYQQGTWLAPGAFFALVWCGYVWMGLLLAWDVYVWSGAVWWIVACVLVVYLGTVLGSSVGRKGQAITLRPPQEFDWPGLKVLILLLSLLGFGAALVLVNSTGRGVSALFSLDTLSQIGSELSGSRYSTAQTGYVEPLLERLLTVAIYLAALLAGILIAVRPTLRRGWLAFLAVLPAAALALVATTKASIFFTLILLTASYLATRAALSAEPWRLFTWARGFVAVLGVLGVAAISVLIQMLRYQYTSSWQALQVLSALRVAFFGYLGVFSDWFQHGAYQHSNLGWGAYSFAGLFQLVGLQARTPGLYGDMAYLGPQGIPSNIFTIFRSLIEDFGFAGSLVALLIVGYAAGLAFSALRRNPTLSIPILSAFYATTLWSHTVNLFSYSTMLLAWILLVGYLLIARSGRVSRSERQRRTTS